MDYACNCTFWKELITGNCNLTLSLANKLRAVLRTAAYLSPMDSFDVFSEGGGVSVSFGAAHNFTDVGFLVAVGAILVFGAVGCVAEGLIAARHLTLIGLLPCVRTQMRLQVL